MALNKAPNVSLSPRQKAAIFIMSLPPELSAQVIRSFPPEEAKALTLEMSKVPTVPEEIRKSVVEEFLENPELQLAGSKTTSPLGTVPHRAAPSPRETEDPRSPGRRPFSFLVRADPRQVFLLIEKENPQTIALILSHLTAASATKILEEIKPPLQGEVARRLAEVGKVRPEVLREIEVVLEEQYYRLMDQGFQESNGRDALMEILNRSDRGTEEKILSGLARKNPKLASDLKNQLCEFEDLAHLERVAIQQLMKITDMKDLVLALKGSSPQIASNVYEAVPPERAKAIQDDVEALKVSDWEEVKAAQQQVRNNLRGLVIIGKIRLSPRAMNADSDSSAPGYGL